MGIAIIDCTPDVLAAVVPLLPRSVRIIGSEAADGYIRLRASIENAPSGRYSVQVSDSATRRIVDIFPINEPGAGNQGE